MKVIYGFPDNLKSKNTYLALGNFDGVHIGHKKIIRSMVNDAQRDAAQSIVVTFDPYPKKVLKETTCPKLLISPDTKTRLIAGLGVDFLVFLPFDNYLARLTPINFLEKVVIHYFEPTAIFVGYNYSFGKGGVGTPTVLRDFGDRMGVCVNVIPPVTIASQPVSSSEIRNFLSAGEIESARKYLGYCPVVEGEVTSGDGLAESLGYPTANLQVNGDLILPAPGIYAAVTSIYGKKYKAAVNVGSRPTVTSGGGKRVEAHILDFKGDLYGEYIRLSMIKWIRDEKKFSSLNELGEQIGKDVDGVRREQVPADAVYL